MLVVLEILMLVFEILVLVFEILVLVFEILELVFEILVLMFEILVLVFEILVLVFEIILQTLIETILPDNNQMNKGINILRTELCLYGNKCIEMSSCIHSAEINCLFSWAPTIPEVKQGCT